MKMKSLGPTWCVVVVPEGVLDGLGVCVGGPDHAHQPALLQPLLGVHPPLVGRPHEGRLVSSLRKLDRNRKYISIKQ